MKKKQHSKGGLAVDLTDPGKVESFKKKDKKRNTLDVLYLSCELQLLFAFVSIFVLLFLPAWLNNKVNLFLAGHNTSMNTEWITIGCNILLAGFAIYLLIRVFWFLLILNRGQRSASRLHFAKTTEHVAELIFSVCMVILIMILLVSLIQFLSILLKNTVSGKMKNYTGMNQ